MPTELDITLDRIMDAVTAPDQMFGTAPIDRGGVEMPAFKAAPPSLSHYFAHYCNEHGDATFLVDGDVRLSFAETYAAAQSAAVGLVTRQGLKRGDRVGIAARNSANWVVAHMAIIMAGGCSTLLNGFSTGNELEDAIALVDCSIVLADEPRAKRLDGSPHADKIVLFDHGVAPAKGLANIWPENGADQTLPDLGPDDLATILYTSGSTGASKGAYSDHRGVLHGIMNYVAQTVMALQYMTGKGEAPTGQPCALVAVPLFHVTGEIPVLLQSIAIGRKLVLMPKWDAVDAMRLMEAETVTYFVGVPLMSYELATREERKDYDLSACKSFAAGGSARPVDHVNKIADSFPEAFPLLGYGLTETNAVGCGNFNENYLNKPGSTGKPSRPIVDLAILNDDGGKLAQGEVGEICIRSVANFLGYWDNDEATEAAFTKDRYFRTGDLGYLDEDDYLFIVDRKKDIIIRGGENISCIEVEEALYGHPDVTECSVFGLPEEKFGEIVAAVYVVRDGADVGADDLREFVSGRIAPFKMPEKIWHSKASLPRLGTQKIDKRTVKSLYENRSDSA
ncbi:Long-chain-fatty-acid--CoA ligase [Alteripontixanthobacter maritimus]|uniref:Long-chain-fatty-acid--CoA ligase n=1 Tax=Alteripontixanthobacter maritimus TaxID=2161824 RepID=A0A369Q7W6_9SPHN|nr:class I adenylate-forming enzyme family protein [Alteripontixanthobacter maritimus]RDC59019.1 Long-chain-fatty-acid--CoA ligase [Alteripontixanthobacter maritimus]